MPQKLRHTTGFSLLELSIVLVIIAVIVGGAVAGQSLLKNAELRSVYTNAQQYIDAINNFRDKYDALPGDFNTATDVWGQVAASCTTQSGSGKLTCNGDGDGRIADDAGTNYELFRAWQHLANAGMVEGKYTGTFSGSAGNATPRVNVPAGPVEGSGYTLMFTDGTSFFSGLTYNFHILNFGAARSTVSSTGPTDARILSGQQAWAIDRKVDDGLPAYGNIITYNNTANSNCASSNTAASATYNTGSSTLRACHLAIRTGF